MIRVFLRRDWTRLRRDPGTVILLLALPIVIALIARTVFAPGDQPVKLIVPMAFVDEDQTALTHMLDGFLSSEQLKKEIFDVRKMDRHTARDAIRSNDLAGALIVPKGFTDAFLANRPCSLQLVTNPARPISSNILVQTFQLLSDFLDGIREIVPELTTLSTVDHAAQETFRQISQVADRIAALSPLVFQFPFQFETSKPASNEKPAGAPTGVLWTLAFIPGLGFLMALFVVASVFRRFSNDLARGAVHRVLVTPATESAMLGGLMLYAFLVVIGMQVVLWVITLLLFRIPVHHPALLARGILQMGLLATLLNGFLYAMPFRERVLESLSSIVTLVVALFSGMLVSPLFMPKGIRQLVTVSPFYQPVDALVKACLAKPTSIQWAHEGILLLVLVSLLALSGLLFHVKITRIVHGEKLGGTA